MTERDYQLQVGAFIEKAALAFKGGNPDAAVDSMGTAVELAEQHPAFAVSASYQLARLTALLLAVASHPSCSTDSFMSAQDLKQRVTMLLRVPLH
jgi:hypothetical protein